jgi:prepilin-type N-terminal cleavage/methylation domain-containing protein
MRRVSTQAQRAARGFTLVELMIVVAILGTLAAVSLPALTSYIYKSKVVEATGFLNEIKARQESYRADFGEYCQVSASQTALYPTTTPRDSPQPWPTPLDPNWTALGAVPPGRSSLFVYSSVAGVPGTVPSFPGSNPTRGYTGNDFWFISTAVGDLDGDGATVTFESYSHSKAIACDLDKGWE